MSKPKGQPAPPPESAPELASIRWKGPEPLRAFLVPIEDLHEDPANTNVHDEESVGRIAASYARFGQQRFLVGDGSNVVRAGNGQLAAARRLGWTHLAFSASDLSGTDLAAFAIADNRTAEFSRRDEEKLAEVLAAIRTEPEFPIDATGYTPREFDDLLERIGARIAEEDHAGEVIDDPAAEWTGMPEFEHEDKTAVQSLHVHFKSREDVEAFARLVGQKITDRTRSIWYPQQEIIRYGEAE